MRRIVLALAAGCLLLSGIRAQDDLRASAAAGMMKATVFMRSIATNGGYIGIYSLDLKQRFGESMREKAGENEIWIQPPGTPTMGETFLLAYRATGDKFYLTAAREVGRALAWAQLDSGGWGHRADLSALKPDSTKPDRKKGSGAFDDNITQGALTFLMNLDWEIDEPWLDDAVQLGLKFMLASQFENGAWPQWYPLKEGYQKYYTFNDGAMNDCIRVMLLAHERYGREEYLQSALRGGDFIILSQGPPPQTGWAQQYSHDMQPAWARAFEPPGYSSASTSHNIRTLVDLFLVTKDEKFLKPIPPAVDWLERSKIGEKKWARLYEVGTNKPIYGDRDKTVHYALEEISKERQTGYGWQGDFGIPAAIAYYDKVKTAGADRYLIQRAKPMTSEERRDKAKAAAASARTAIAALDKDGRWTTPAGRADKDSAWGDQPVITTREYIRNMRALCDYLELSKE